MVKLFTVTIICRDNKEVLLGLKKKGFGADKWNGFGGKQEDGETIEETAIRELKEEAGISSVGIKELGVIRFSFENDPDILEVHYFRADNWIGEIKETDEMIPCWFGIKDIPYNNMWPDDKFWLPLLLENQEFNGFCLYNKDDDNKIINAELRWGMIGPTGRFPQGKLNPEDEGEIKIRIRAEEGNIIIEFGKPISWLGMTSESALAFYRELEKKIKALA